MARDTQDMKSTTRNDATVGYEAQLWRMADALRCCHTQASSLDELMARAREAIEVCLEGKAATEAAALGRLPLPRYPSPLRVVVLIRGGSLQELKEILGHADITMTLRYAHLSPAHLRSAMLKTERTSAQDSAKEVVGVLEASRK